jgi:2-keto-4-pentenoate hydratase/2-oxohepta-3-ene-1,7-dioic acid hydratase in catechol pathway
VNPPQPLKVGDTVELGIDGIGTISQEIITWKGAL